jgi:Protein of unknown function (DUF1168)
MGSSAGAGSGEFHVYRHLRRKEYARQKHLKMLSETEKLDLDYQDKLEMNQMIAEERTNKKRQKRLKKKNKQKQKGKKPKLQEEVSNSEHNTDDDDDDDDNDDKNDDQKSDNDASENNSEHAHNEEEIKDKDVEEGNT